MRSPDFAATLARHGLRLRRRRLRTLQLNVGLRCDLACHHCHVEAGPKRPEALTDRTAERVLEVLAQNPELATLDLTGGAPELDPHFRELVARARALGREVIDRCNLTVLLQPGQQDTAEFLARHGVRVVASLPCYTPETVDRQRGRDVFAHSLEALRRLAALGYGQGGALRLDLVYNPAGPTLPPAQRELEALYRRELFERYGLGFDRLIAITNMPIKRFARDLARRGVTQAYQALLVNHFNPGTVPGLMCRDTLSVDHDGRLFDCDFNQAVGLPLGAAPATLWELSDLAELDGAAVATGAHCFGCTAGAGSSCGGALA